MAESACPRCGKGELEMVMGKPDKAKFPVSLVQCSACGTVVGVLEYLAIGDAMERHGMVLANHGALLERIAKAVKA